MDSVTIESAPDVLLDRINQAREAVGFRQLDELAKAMPTAPCGCVIAVNLGATAWVSEIAVEDENVAEAIAKAWETSITPGAPAGWGRFTVRLPQDLRRAAALFDAGELENLIEPSAMICEALDSRGPTELPL